MRALSRVVAVLFCSVAALLVGCNKQQSSRAGAEPALPTSHFISGPTASHSRLIVFVHGVTGGPESTWQNPGSPSWPKMIASDLTDCDVYVYGYQSPMLSDASGINEIAVRMLTQLQDQGVFERYSEVFFVTHSMGGLITKRVLVMLNTPANHPKLEKVRLALFISVPAAGAPIAAIASLFTRNPQFEGMDPQNAKDFLQSLDGDWDTIFRSRSAQEPFPRTYIAYEKLNLDGVLVVPELYISHMSDDRPVAFDRNHGTIVEPKDAGDDVYQWAKARILDADHYPVIPPGPPAPLTASCKVSSRTQERGNPADDNSQQEVYFVRCAAEGRVLSAQWGGCTYMGDEQCKSINKRDDLSRPCPDNPQAACIYYQTNDGNQKLVHGTFTYVATGH